MSLQIIINELKAMRHGINYCLLTADWEWALIECEHEHRPFTILFWSK